MTQPHDVLVILPTYNERDTLESVVSELLRATQPHTSASHTPDSLQPGEGSVSAPEPRALQFPGPDSVSRAPGTDSAVQPPAADSTNQVAAADGTSQVPAADSVQKPTLGAIHLLIIDDASPDGTGDLADALAAADPRISVEHRSGKLGLGTAYIHGFRIGLERGYRLIVEMDADGSHLPTELPHLLAAARGEQAAGPASPHGGARSLGTHAPGTTFPPDGTHPHGGTPLPGGTHPHGGTFTPSATLPHGSRLPLDCTTPGLVIGTRWIEGGVIKNWPLYRRMISRIGTAVARLALRSRLHDITSGFRVFNADWLRRIDFDEITSQGYGFQVEVAWLLERSGCPIVEVPITFVERAGGESKMSLGIVTEALVNVLLWGFNLRFRPQRLRGLAKLPARRD